MPWMSTLASLLVLAGMCVFLYPYAASWFSQRDQSRAVATAQEQMQQPPNDDERYVAEQLARAHAYNDALASGAIVEAGENIPVGDGALEEEGLVYADLLALTGGGFMGRLRYGQLNIDLPIYHGTSERTLEQGIGHLKGTSLPVGGVGTRAVLTAHRGLPTATLFDDLDKAEVGDTFTVSVLDQVLTYRVVETQIIQPEETQSILADPDRDLVTLVTCTPLGINSQRILVTGERITPTPVQDIEAAGKAPEIPGFPWWAVVLGGTAVALAAYVWSSGFQPRRARGERAPLPG